VPRSTTPCDAKDYLAMQHRHDLERRAWIGYLLPRIGDDRHWLMLPNDVGAAITTPLVGPENRRTVAVLDAVDQAWETMMRRGLMMAQGSAPPRSTSE
jgi:hypothetical protein